MLNATSSYKQHQVQKTATPHHFDVHIVEDKFNRQPLSCCLQLDIVADDQQRIF